MNTASASEKGTRINCMSRTRRRFLVMLICAGSLFLAFFATKPWHYLLGYGGIVGVGMGFGTLVPAGTAVTRWFKRYRGRAMGICLGASGIAGFVVAVPLMAYAIATSKIVPGAQADAGIIFGNPPLMRIFIELFHPGTDPATLLLSPVGRAAWVGLFATALNLLPSWQLDGGHIIYSLSPERHQRISLLVAIILIGMGIYYWHGWGLWGIALMVLSFRFRHPPLFDRWTPLDASRKLWAFVALIIFLLCFSIIPAAAQ